MKPTNATLNALLASRQFILARLYTITLASGTVLRYCGGDKDITSGGNTYLAGGQTGPYIEKTAQRAMGHWAIGSGSDSIQIQILPGTSTVMGQTFLTAVRVGIFDGADFQMDYAFMSTYGTVQSGCQVTIFKGRVAEVIADRNLVVMTVNDYRELFNQNLPRNLFAASCANTLYDASCTVNPASFSESGTILAGSTATSLMANLIRATGFYDLGKLTWTSGANNGLSIGISRYVLGTPCTITPIVPVPLTVNAGDTFTIFAGCDRTLGAGGCAKFANTANFRGEPYIPAPETAL